MARRRVEQYRREAYCCDYNIVLTGFPNCNHLEVCDLVDVTHSRAGFSGKEFIITKKSEDALGETALEIKAYHSGVYTDKTVPFQRGYYSNFNRLMRKPPYIENLVVTDNSSWDNGYWFPILKVEYDVPTTAQDFHHSEIQYAKNYAGASTVSTVSGGSTTITFDSGDDYNAVSEGTIIQANGEWGAILSKDGSNQCTLAIDVDWYNGGGGHSFTHQTFSKYWENDYTRGENCNLINIGIQDGDTFYARVVSVSSFGAADHRRLFTLCVG